MDGKSAFGVLLAEVNAAIEESLARYTAAIQQGDLSTMELEQERQRNLLNARNQLEVLADLWPDLVGKGKPAKKPRPRKKRPAPTEKLKRGQRTPEQAYVVPILYTLEKMGGSGRVSDVLDGVSELMSGTLKGPDLEPVPSGRQIRWRNTAQWARYTMKEDGLLAHDSPSGTWEITQRGRAYLHEHADDVARLTV